MQGPWLAVLERTWDRFDLLEIAIVVGFGFSS